MPWSAASRASALRSLLPESLSALVATTRKSRPALRRKSISCRSGACAGTLAVNEHDGERQGLAVFEIGFNEFWPFGGNLLREFGVSVAGQIDKHQLRMRLAGLGIDPDKVDGARASRSGADVRHLLAEQGIDQAGLADVRPAQKGELRRAFRGKEFGVGGGGEEFGDGGLHSVTTSLAESVRPRFGAQDFTARA